MSVKNEIKAVAKDAELHGTLTVSGRNGVYCKIHVGSERCSAEVTRYFGVDCDGPIIQTDEIKELCAAISKQLYGS